MDRQGGTRRTGTNGISIVGSSGCGWGGCVGEISTPRFPPYANLACNITSFCNNFNMAHIFDILKYKQCLNFTLTVHLPFKAGLSTRENSRFETLAFSYMDGR